MAPLPTNLTARMFFDYVSGDSLVSREHTTMVRYEAAVADIPAVQAQFLDFLQALGPGRLRNGWKVVRARNAAQGSDFSVPVPLATGLAAFVGTSNAQWTLPRESQEWKWVGRSFSTGRRTSHTMYGLTPDFPQDFRVLPGDPAYPWAGPTIAVLNENPVTGIFRGPDGTPVVWYDYINTNYNSYWERQIRTGG